MLTSAEIKTVSNPEGKITINLNLSVPALKGDLVVDALRSMLTLSGVKVRRVDEEGEEVFSAKEVFPDGSPAMAFRGLRAREGITQIEMAERLGISQNMISGMESGKRSITTKMAKRIEQEFGISYKVFL
jgi:antitoxin component HigA of HigAB toxin-antitoxin module